MVREVAAWASDQVWLPLWGQKESSRVASYVCSLSLVAFFTGLVYSLCKGVIPPLCSSNRDVWGAMDAFHLFEWAFNALSVFFQWDHRPAAITTVVIYSPWGAAMLYLNQNHVSGPSSSRHALPALPRLPDNKTQTGIWRASFQKSYCRIQRANWEEKWVNVACHCHQSSLINKSKTLKCQLALQKPATVKLSPHQPKRKNNKTKLTALLPR